MRQVAVIRLLLYPIIVFPTLLSYQHAMARSYVPDTMGQGFKLWVVLIASLALCNLLMLVLTWRRATEPPSRPVYTLSLVAVALELGANQVSLWGVGTLTASGSVIIVAFISAYRVFIDYWHSLLAVVVGLGLFVLTAMLELNGVVPVIPGAAAPVSHPGYLPDVSGSILVGVVGACLALFIATNYGVNQAVKLHRYITEAVLRRYLPPSLVARASRGELRLDAPAERRIVTVMFVDLVGFTSLSERIGAEAVGQLANRYLSVIAETAHGHGATVDKFIGDAVMIVFGAPEPMPPDQQAKRAVRLALEIQQVIPSIDPELALLGRAGINTGEAVVGNFGSLVRSDYTVIGPAVNVAARLESMSRPGRVLIGEATAALLDSDIPLEDAGELTLKGVTQPVRAYHLKGR